MTADTRHALAFLARLAGFALLGWATILAALAIVTLTVYCLFWAYLQFLYFMGSVLVPVPVF